MNIPYLIWLDYNLVIIILDKYCLTMSVGFLDGEDLRLVQLAGEGHALEWVWVVLLVEAIFNDKGCVWVIKGVVEVAPCWEVAALSELLLHCRSFDVLQFEGFICKFLVVRRASTHFMLDGDTLEIVIKVGSAFLGSDAGVSTCWDLRVALDFAAFLETVGA